MPKITVLSDKVQRVLPPAEILSGKRHLTPSEINILIGNRNISSDPDWQNIYVSAEPGAFNPEQIVQSEFSGWIVLGTVRNVSLKYHDLELRTGIIRSYVENVFIGDDCVVHNVNYLRNYHLSARVMLFNIQEMSCTRHSKFGEGLLKEGESEKNRIWIEVGNENGGRSVLAFKDMIPADAYLWSRYRDDKELMERFVELTESSGSRRNDTYGYVGEDAVIKNCTLIKDARIENNAYIKGAFKLKNITVLSSEDEPSQIGEGVELVNGIMGYGCHVFYQAVAVRFVIGRNCQLKYGARLLNSVLGDNSTISCCEVLNNLIFPFHEQHHNSSFLIASTLQGQSNIASNATIGSNHNSRSPDGEMIAGRGFWPGLCTDFKFVSKFASFVLVAKGSYQNELNITYPFSLLAPSYDGDCTVHIIPGYWFMYNMFAIVRNKYKFASRDKRFVKVQHIETNPFAPDTIQETFEAVNRIVELTARYLKLPEDQCAKNTQSNPEPKLLQETRELIQSAESEEEALKIAKSYLHLNRETKFLLFDSRCQKKNGAVIYKPAQGYREYRRIIKYFSVEALLDWAKEKKVSRLTLDHIRVIEKVPLYTKWQNVGGQVIAEEKIAELFDLVKNGKINNWHQVHDMYNEFQASYTEYKARYALYLLSHLYTLPVSEFSGDIYQDIIDDVTYVSDYMYRSSIESREKDYTDFFRSVTFRNKEEMEAVLGTIKDSSFLQDLEVATKEFDDRLHKVFAPLAQ